MGVVIKLDDRCYDCPCPKIETIIDTLGQTIVKCERDLVCHHNLTYLYERIKKGEENDQTRR